MNQEELAKRGLKIFPRLKGEALKCKRKAERALEDNKWSGRERERIVRAKERAERAVEEYTKKIEQCKAYLRRGSGPVPAVPPAMTTYNCGLPMRVRSQVEEKLNNESKSEASLKSPKDWTQDELREAMKAREKASPSDKQDMMLREKEWFDHFYGTAPVGYDETSKMLQPKPRLAIPEQSRPLQSKDGQTLPQAIEQIMNIMPDDKDEAALVKAVQAGVNWLSNQLNKANPSRLERPVMLKEDGIAGPKTSLGLKKALVAQGTPKVAEAVALGQFKDLLKQAKTTGAQNLAQSLGKTIGPLLPKMSDDSTQAQPEGLALQDTLNDFGAGLKDDGIVGPKTESAFEKIAKTEDEDVFLNRFAENLGFVFS